MIWRIWKNQLQSDMFKKGDMPTFLDAWLSGQARKQKWVGGIEGSGRQLEHIGAVEEKIQLAIFDDEYFPQTNGVADQGLCRSAAG